MVYGFEITVRLDSIKEEVSIDKNRLSMEPVQIELAKREMKRREDEEKARAKQRAEEERQKKIDAARENAAFGKAATRPRTPSPPPVKAEPLWVVPGIRCVLVAWCGSDACSVRIVSHTVGNGKYYTKKGTVDDVASIDNITVAMDDGASLHGVPLQLSAPLTWTQTSSSGSSRRCCPRQATTC